MVKNPPAMWVDLGLIPWRRERLCTPVFCPGEFHGLYRPCVAESDMTEQLSLSHLEYVKLFTFIFETNKTL